MPSTPVLILRWGLFPREETVMPFWSFSKLHLLFFVFCIFYLFIYFDLFICYFFIFPWEGMHSGWECVEEWDRVRIRVHVLRHSRRAPRTPSCRASEFPTFPPNVQMVAHRLPVGSHLPWQDLTVPHAPACGLAFLLSGLSTRPPPRQPQPGCPFPRPPPSQRWG